MQYYKYIQHNKLRSILFIFLTFLCLFISLSVIIILFTVGFGKPQENYINENEWVKANLYNGLFYSVLVTMFIIFILYLNSTKITLSLAKAQEITDKSKAPELFDIVDEISIAAGITMPKIYVIDDDAMNAFACGTDKKGYICFTMGILNALNREELQGVAAHEISHLKNGDSRLMTIIAGVGFAIGIIANIGTNLLWFGGRSRNRDDNGLGLILVLISFITVIFAPLLSAIVQCSLSRKREWVADDASVELTRNPSGLRSALEKLSMAESTAIHKAPHNLNHLWIAEPHKHLPNKKHEKSGLMDTHPPLSRRIEHLRELEQSSA